MEEVSDLEPPPFVLSHAIAQILCEIGPSALKGLRNEYLIATLYAIGYSGRPDFVPDLIKP